MQVTALEDAAAAYEVPRLVRLAPNLYGVAFALMKLIPARHILRQAQLDGRLRPDAVIVETTSGTFGLALAMQAVHLPNRLILVSDPVIDHRLHRRLTDLGAMVQRVPAAAAAQAGGYQAARLARLAQLRTEHPATFWPDQYANPQNSLAYATVADMLLRSLGALDCIVGPVGSGGSMCGTVARLRATLPHCQAIAVDTHHSILFGHADGSRELRGMGMSLMPANLDHRLFDEVHWCSATAAYAATRQLHRSHALFMGPTSGAAYCVARWWAGAHPDALTVVLLPDEGHRYLDTVYDNRWLAPRQRPVPAEPTYVTDPTITGLPWPAYRWGRRTYPDVMAGRPLPASATMWHRTG